MKKSLKPTSESAETLMQLPSLLFPPKNKREEAWMTLLKKQKKIRKIGPRLYTSVAPDKVAFVVRSQWSDIISHLFPEAILSHRSAFEFQPNEENAVVLTGTTNRIIEYPGLVLYFVRGPESLDDDGMFLNIKVSSPARAYLENLSNTQKTSWRSIGVENIESNLERLMKVKGEEELFKIRDRAKEIAKKFKWERENKKLQAIIGALLGSRPDTKLKTESGRARSRGKPFDTERLILFDALAAKLLSTPVIEYKDEFKAPDHFINKAFFESYFSNYIEGTTFEIEEAEEIIFDHKIPEQRPKDAHDILGTFQLVSDPNVLSATPNSPEELEDLLKQRHRVLMKERQDVAPGEYKAKPNRAGDTHFVSPNEIAGTLEKGFERYKYLPEGFARAVFMMFLVAEVHPFNDGNGRLARVMMNAELYSRGLSTIIIPTVYREDYIMNLRALTRRQRPEGLIKMLNIAYKFSYFEFAPYSKALKTIEEKNWFREPSEAKLKY